MSAIEFKDVSKSFGDAKVLDGLSFSVEKGEFFVVLGLSGTGKSVMLKHIVGLLSQDSGEINVATNRIGYLFQTGALLAWKTVWENVALPLEEGTKLTDEEIADRVRAVLKDVGLEDAADKYPAEISGGMQKRAGLARSIVRDSEIILYDEPTSGLDPVTASHIIKLIRDINRKRGITSVMVTHDLVSALKVADRIMLLDRGKAVCCCRADEFSKEQEKTVKEFIAATNGEFL